MNNKEISSKKLREMVKEIYGVLNLMTILNLVILAILGIIIVKAKLFSRGSMAAGISLGIVFVLVWYALKGQIKKLTYKKNLGRGLSDEAWKNFNLEIERPSTRGYGDINNMTIKVLTKSFLFFPTKKNLEIIPIEDIVSLEKKINKGKGNKKDQVFINLTTASQAKFTLDYEEELFQKLKHKV